MKTPYTLIFVEPDEETVGAVFNRDSLRKLFTECENRSLFDHISKNRRFKNDTLLDIIGSYRNEPQRLNQIFKDMLK